MRLLAVPAADGAACAGRGLPVAALGACQCWAGYDGRACDACAPGYARAPHVDGAAGDATAGLCLRTLQSLRQQALLASDTGVRVGQPHPHAHLSCAHLLERFVKVQVGPLKGSTLGRRNGQCGDDLA